MVNTELNLQRIQLEYGHGLVDFMLAGFYFDKIRTQWIIIKHTTVGGDQIDLESFTGRGTQLKIAQVDREITDY